jgi:hypothetical protein
MAMIPQRSLFSWSEIESSSDLDRLRLVLDVLPDEPFMKILEKRRGKGRNDYPVRPTWNALLAGIVFQHLSAASLLRELSRNAELRQLCGFDPAKGAAAVPSADAFGRFLAIVIDSRDGLLEIFHRLLASLGREIPGLGARLAADSKGIRSFGKPVRDEEKRTEEDGRRDTDADWGIKTYRRTGRDGSTWEDTIRWFGYKLHLLVDSLYEIPLSFRLTEASAGDSPELLDRVADLEAHHPELAKRAAELTADKAYDSFENNRLLYDQYGIKPLIDIRACWPDETETKAVVAGRADVFVYDEKGRVSCVCPCSGEKRDLAFQGFEEERKALKYRCPAAAYGFECKGRERCGSFADVGPFGRTLRVPLDTDRRVFTPIPRSTRRWKKAYDRRSAVERVNSRLDNVLGFEKHTIRGMKKMEARVSLALIGMLAMALGRIRANQPARIRSLVGPAVRATG